jgi:LacI family transcriptional regulator
MLLAELLKGASPPARPVWVPPLGVVARASTGALGAGDPLVAEALAFMHDHAHEPFSVDDLLISLNISRRSLERKFRKHLRRTPLQEIQRLHLRQAQHLLAQTDYPIGQAARRSGFASPQHMATRFRQAIGLTPSAYRKQYRRILTLEAEGQERVKG